MPRSRRYAPALVDQENLFPELPLRQILAREKGNAIRIHPEVSRQLHRISIEDGTSMSEAADRLILLGIAVRHCHSISDSLGDLIDFYLTDELKAG
jgi:hypothetical protein